MVFSLALRPHENLFNSFVFVLIINTTRAQDAVPVRLEPRHHNVFENNYVRVLDVHILPGDTTMFHKHETPSVFIVLNNAKTGPEVISEAKIVNAPVTFGNIWFDGFYVKPRIHRVWNSDTIPFHVMDIELLDKEPKETGVVTPQQKSIRMLFDEKVVRSYSCLLSAHSTIKIKESECPVLIIGLSDNKGEASINNKWFKQKGDFIFIPAGSKSLFINKGNDAAQFAILELK